MRAREGLLAMALVCAAGTPASPGVVGASARYRELVRLYVSGERAKAIADLGQWSEKDLQREFKALRDSPGEPDEQRLLLQAAIMLHTDREAFERSEAPVVETPRLCGIAPPAAFAESLVGILAIRHQGGGFARRWYLAMTLRRHGDLCLEDALHWARAGLKWFPQDAPLLLAQGTAEEVADLLSVAPPARPWMGSRQLAQTATEHSRRRQNLERARQSLEEALSADPDLHEARLRLGRVLWRLERGEDARAPLEVLLRQPADPSSRHLGHLFLGRIHEDAGRLVEAEAQYRAAARLHPPSQVAAVALSHVLQLAGDMPASRQVLDQAVAQAPRRDDEAFWWYHMGRAREAEDILEELRREALR